MEGESEAARRLGTSIGSVADLVTVVVSAARMERQPLAGGEGDIPHFNSFIQDKKWINFYQGYRWED